MNLKLGKTFPYTGNVPLLKLPVEVAGEAIAILAKRGAGKTNTAVVLVEELHTAGVQFVVLDPVGVWWGIRSGQDGTKKDGIGVPVIGGAHGDVPLEPTAGELIADVVVDTGQSVVVDVSEMSKTQQRAFVAAFSQRLYRAKAQSRSVLHVVLEEADEFAPQRVSAKDAPMVGAISQLIRRGRSRGIGMTVITQRSASLNKDVLDQADVLIAMRTTGPRDRKAIEGWIEHQDAEGIEWVLPSLPSLKTGEAWVWNPERSILERTQVRTRRTFDTSGSPGAGGKRNEPRSVAPIDLAKLGKRIEETAEKAKANDPAELRRQIRDLERRLSSAENSAVTQTVEVEKIVERKIEVPALTAAERKLVERAITAVNKAGEAMALLAPVASKIQELKLPTHVITELTDISLSVDKRALPGQEIRKIDYAQQRPVPLEQAPTTRFPDMASAPKANGDVKLGKGELTVLGVLAEFPEGRTQNEVAFLAGYSAKASTIGVILSTLRKGGYVEPGQPIRPTQSGLDVVGGPVERPRGQALLDKWLRHPRMGEGERKVMLALIDLYPNVPSNDELCELTGYSPQASTMGVILSKLRKLGLVEKGQRRIAPELMEAIRE